ncbi:zinc metallochaperone AztD [Rathayibacter sp. VKM Ac-2760]|uniref:zinc metallochaperone AztD n=1 Tax=Rathayibacter sp. VKM Ac-2760 TaxID=2609253 RepID=UPI0013183E23|nr:zinc metallochaperone AztD [Rathayibacter sp. VKM Ac-2760]QHC60229.1 hypothetical protein GSU72_17980 [Rathayibacter sp. VKM Ac-2760]
MNYLHRRALAGAALTATAALVLSGCSGAGDAAPAASSATPSAAAASTRVALTYDGGLLVLDGETLETEADIALAGFNRVNTAGDDRHVLVSTEGGFRVLDVATPELTDLVFDAPTPGHVVRHHDRTILFADGTGATTVFDTDALTPAVAEGSLPDTETVAAPAAHHGVSIELADGTLLTTIGDSEGRTGVRALDSERTETARNEDCPSVHGEGAAADEIAVFGCSNGVLVYDDGAFTKITAPDTYGRTGNQYVSETSPITVGDYNSDPDAEGVELSKIVLTDTVAKESTVHQLDFGYTWRGIARTADDGGLILGTDGALHTLDVATGEITASFPVIDPWSGPIEWQEAHPALSVVGDVAYVTDPAASAVHTVDVATGEVLASATLPGKPIELAVVAG